MDAVSFLNPEGVDAVKSLPRTGINTPSAEQTLGLGSIFSYICTKMGT